MTGIPCEASPEDWFIEKSGKQYDDDPVITLEEAKALAEETESFEELEAAIDELRAERISAALLRRRRARDLCFTECPVRTQCLGIALSEPTPANYGTWGGYHSEQLRAIRRERDRKRAQQ